jgi:hypothetical protein
MAGNILKTKAFYKKNCFTIFACALSVVSGCETIRYAHKYNTLKDALLKNAQSMTS